MTTFYNEIDQHCCAWLSNLMDAGLISPGVICDKSIEDIQPRSLMRYDRVHMFAGIGGWEYAFQLAGWRPEPGVRAWTGSCPCQPFSSAGKGDGFADERHLWPAWFHLIRECRPNVVFGEQVASAIRHGWLDLVSADLEAEGYAVGGAVLGAHSVGAPHIRQRLYWVASVSEWHEQSGQESRSRSAGRMGWVQQPIPWNEPWADAFPRLRALDDGIPRSVAGTDAARNAIVPQTAAAFIRAFVESSEAVRAAA